MYTYTPDAASDAVVVMGGTLILKEKIGWGSVVGMVVAWATSLLYRRAREDTDPQAHYPAWQRRDWVSQERVGSLVETVDEHTTFKCLQMYTYRKD